MSFRSIHQKSNVDFSADGTIHIYTDGSCLNNGTSNAACGWAYICSRKGESESFIGRGRCLNGTNNQMEMIAAIQGLHAASEKFGSNVPVSIYSDSKYVIETLKGNFKVGKNQELWNALFSEVRKFKYIQFQWVKGHQDNLYNIEVDRMATEESALAAQGK